MQVDEGDRVLMSREEIENKIATLTGGRAAEEVIFGSISTGASNDIEQATKLARAMLTRYGMSDRFDMVALEVQSNKYLGGDSSLACSEKTAGEIDEAVIALVKRQHQKAVEILKANELSLIHIFQRQVTEVGYNDFLNMVDNGQVQEVAYESDNEQIIFIATDKMCIRDRARGIVTDKGEQNRWIRSATAMLRTLGEQIKTLVDWLSDARVKLDKPYSPSLGKLLADYYDARTAGAWSSKAKAVSYTHLDVYKRQVMEALPSLTVSASPVRSERISTLWPFSIVSAAFRFMPQSLFSSRDVYKRQRPWWTRSRASTARSLFCPETTITTVLTPSCGRTSPTARRARTMSCCLKSTGSTA